MRTRKPHVVLFGGEVHTIPGRWVVPSSSVEEVSER